MFTKKDLFRLIIPLMVEQILAVTIGMADTMMVSTVGEAAVSGVALVDAINVLIICVFSALATGGAVISSQYIGRKDNENATKAGKQLILVTLVLSLGIMLICLGTKDFILNIIFGKIETNVMEGCKVYFLYSLLSYPFIALFNAGAALFRAMGNTKISMMTSVFMNITNVILNALFIFGLNLGIAGAAIATLISRILGSIYILILLRIKDGAIRIDSYLKLGYSFKTIKRILNIGIPTGFENGLFQICKLLVQSLVATFGTVAIAANAVATNLIQIEILPASAIGVAMVTVVGQCVGARQLEQAKYYVKLLMKYSYISMFVVSVLILIFARPLLSLYNLSGETLDVAFRLLFYHCIFGIVIWPASFTLPNAFRAANDVRYTMYVAVISVCIVRIGFSYWFGAGLKLGIDGVFFAMILDWVVRTVFFVRRFKNQKWLTFV